MATTDGTTATDTYSLWSKRGRDLGLYLVGLVALIRELFFADEIRPIALLVIGALLGVPLTLRGDEKRRGEDG